MFNIMIKTNYYELYFIKYVHKANNQIHIVVIRKLYKYLYNCK